MKILCLDIETAPNLAHVWGLWKQNVNLKMLEKPSHMLCWSASWLHSDEVLFCGLNTHTQEEMLKEIHKLLDAADAVVHYNGCRFDIPTINGEFFALKMPPPRPYKQVDLYQTVKKKFRLPSNKLDFVAQLAQIGKKVEHEGFELWLKCMAGDSDAWDRMQTYNEQDVQLLKDLYEEILPWTDFFPHAALVDGVEDIMICPKCGSDELMRNGKAYTSVSVFQMYQCKECKSYFRGRKNLMRRDKLLVRIT